MNHLNIILESTGSASVGKLELPHIEPVVPDTGFALEGDHRPLIKTRSGGLDW